VDHYPLNIHKYFFYSYLYLVVLVVLVVGGLMHRSRESLASREYTKMNSFISSRVSLSISIQEQKRNIFLQI